MQFRPIFERRLGAEKAPALVQFRGGRHAPDRATKRGDDVLFIAAWKREGPFGSRARLLDDERMIEQKKRLRGHGADIALAGGAVDIALKP